MILQRKQNIEMAYRPIGLNAADVIIYIFPAFNQIGLLKIALRKRQKHCSLFIGLLTKHHIANTKQGNSGTHV